MAQEISFQLHLPRSTLMAGERYICCFSPLFAQPDGCNSAYLPADGAVDAAQPLPLCAPSRVQEISDSSF